MQIKNSTSRQRRPLEHLRRLTLQPLSQGAAARNNANAHGRRHQLVPSGSRLADDAGLSRSTLNRLINGLTSPTFTSIYGITQALEKQLQRHLDPRELISIDGTHRTPSVCE